MYFDFKWLHLINFKFMTNLPESAMNKLAEFLTDFSSYIRTKHVTRTISLFCWDSLLMTLPEEYNKKSTFSPLIRSQLFSY